MLRDLFMAALGAASGLGLLVVITVVLKLRENAERHRRGVARLAARNETYEDYFRRTEMSSFNDFD